jgi:hypothetical protein
MVTLSRAFPEGSIASQGHAVFGAIPRKRGLSIRAR